ncbi:stage II sporulation protein M [Paenibacillus sp. y28]|uniref:stage II sporulation protein M n=1 Tax=Paenibacillus sp. y28 TaxID=3129110 RepID=UPI003015B8DF
MGFKELFLHMGGMKKYIGAAVMVFATGIFLGSVFANEYKDFVMAQLSGLGKIKEEIEGREYPQLLLFIIIFLNNAIKSVLVVLSGVLLGVFPIAFLALNGLVLGYIGAVQAEQGMLMQVIKVIVPHGVLEIPAIILASAYGMRFGALCLKALVGALLAPARGEAARKELKQFVRMLKPLSILLVLVLLVAAIIESTFSYWLAGI